ncbi:integrase catalytic domain-containing protein [Trichonephila clavipes]|nr:integrase catalytic domain-containing protein [Trichonephila clavipes]
MDNVSEHVDIWRSNSKKLTNSRGKLKELLFGLETAKPTEEAEFEEDLYKCETRLDDLEVTEENGLSPPAELPVLTNPEDTGIECGGFLNTVLSSTASRHRKNVLISTGSVFLRNTEGRELKCPVIFDSAIIKDNEYKVNKELLFRETEFGWIAGGRLQRTNTNNFSCYFLKDNDSVEDTLKLFFELESLGIKDDPCYRTDDQAMNIFKETVQYNNRYVVELPFRKHWNELSNNISVAKQRFQSLWRKLRRNKTLYTQYKETIQGYLNQGIIEKVKDTEINVHKPMYYLPHQAIKKEGRVTTSTRIVFDAASHQANEL